MQRLAVEYLSRLSLLSLVSASANDRTDKWIFANRLIRSAWKNERRSFLINSRARPHLSFPATVLHFNRTFARAVQQHRPPYIFAMFFCLLLVFKLLLLMFCSRNSYTCCKAWHYLLRKMMQDANYTLLELTKIVGSRYSLLSSLLMITLNWHTQQSAICIQNTCSNNYL